MPEPLELHILLDTDKLPNTDQNYEFGIVLGCYPGDGKVFTSNLCPWHWKDLGFKAFLVPKVPQGNARFIPDVKRTATVADEHLKNWLDDRFERLKGEFLSRTLGKVETVEPVPSLQDETVKRLAFSIMNLSREAAPIPQNANVSHVIEVPKQDELSTPTGDGPSLVVLPTFKITVDQTTYTFEPEHLTEEQQNNVRNNDQLTLTSGDLQCVFYGVQAALKTPDLLGQNQFAENTHITFGPPVNVVERFDRAFDILSLFKSYRNQHGWPEGITKEQVLNLFKGQLYPAHGADIALFLSSQFDEKKYDTWLTQMDLESVLTTHADISVDDDLRTGANELLSLAFDPDKHRRFLSRLLKQVLTLEELDFRKNPDRQEIQRSWLEDQLEAVCVRLKSQKPGDSGALKTALRETSELYWATIGRDYPSGLVRHIKNGLAGLAKAPNALPEVSQTPPPGTICLNHLHPPGNDETDPLAAVNGLSILLHRKGDIKGEEPIVRCLTASQATLEAGTASTEYLGINSLPLAYIDGTVKFEAAYEGLPLAVGAPTTNTNYALKEGASSQGVNQIPEVHYRHYPHQGSPEWVRLPLLAYGARYRALGFYIHQSGALPHLLRKQKSPWTFDLPDNTSALPFPEEYAQCQRQTPVGLIGLTVTKHDQESPVPQEVLLPPGVRPLAKDLKRTAVATNGPGHHLFCDDVKSTAPNLAPEWTFTLEELQWHLNVTTQREALSIEFQGANLCHEIELQFERADQTLKVYLNSFGTASNALMVTTDERLRLTVSSSQDRWQARLEGSNKSITLDSPTGVSLKRLLKVVVKARSEETFGSETNAFHFDIPVMNGHLRDSEAYGLSRARNVIVGAQRKFEGVVDQCRIELRPPAVSFACWDRHWGCRFLAAQSDAEKTKLKGHRRNVWAGWLLGTEKNHQSRANQKRPGRPVVDLSLQDPLVTDILLETTLVFAPQGGVGAYHRWVYPVSDLLAGVPDPKLKAPTENPAAEKINRLLRSAISPDAAGILKIEVVDPKAQRTPSESGLEVKPGEVWQITARPLVRFNSLETGWTSAFTPHLPDQFTSAGVRAQLEIFNFQNAEYLAGQPVLADLEVASTQLPSFHQIRATLQPRVVKGRTLEVLAQIPESTSSYRFAYLDKLELYQQFWYWTGRPTPPFPAGDVDKLSSGPKDVDAKPEDYRKDEVERLANFLRWEVDGFGDRQADGTRSDHLFRQEPFTIHSDDLSSEERALYARFRALPRSRYESIAKGGIPSPEPTASELQDPWRRCFLPAKQPDEVSPPPIRAVIPLTLAESTEDTGCVSLLAITSESAYEIGGLAEQILVDVSQTDRVVLNSKGTEVGTLQEFGPDPIRTGKAWGSHKDIEGTLTFVPEDRILPSVKGPIGYTYDVGGRSRVFANSSFILDFRRNLDWHFAKLSFQRLLRPEACEGYKPPSFAMPRTLKFEVGDAPAYYLDLESDAAIAVTVKARFPGGAESVPLPNPEKGFLRVVLERRKLVKRTTRKDDEFGSIAEAIWQVSFLTRDGVPIHNGLVWGVSDFVTNGEPEEPKLKFVTVSVGDFGIRHNGIRKTATAFTLPIYHISQPTRPQWCQLGTNFSQFEDDGKRPISVDELRAVYNATTNKWQFIRWVDGGAEQVSVQPSPRLARTKQKGYLVNCLMALGTIEVKSASQISERFVALYHLGDDSQLTLLAEARNDWYQEEQITTFRILEVETLSHHLETVKGAIDWSFLQPPKRSGEEAEDALARIVKVSPPIGLL